MPMLIPGIEVIYNSGLNKRDGGYRATVSEITLLPEPSHDIDDPLAGTTYRQVIWSSDIIYSNEDTAREEAELAVDCICYERRHQLRLL